MYRRFSEKHCGGDGFPAPKSSDPAQRHVPHPDEGRCAPTPGMGTNTGAYTIMWTGRSAFSSRRRTRISIRPPSVSVRLRSCFSDFRQKSCTRPSRIFHNTPDRCRLFREAIERDAAAPRPFSRRSILLLQGKRRCPCSRTFFFCRRDPARVAHNDTKLNNVLLDAKTRKALCVVDLTP